MARCTNNRSGEGCEEEFIGPELTDEYEGVEDHCPSCVAEARYYADLYGGGRAQGPYTMTAEERAYMQHWRHDGFDPEGRF